MAELVDMAVMAELAGREPKVNGGRTVTHRT
jgi:hypothetical protein